MPRISRTPPIPCTQSAVVANVRRTPHAGAASAIAKATSPDITSQGRDAPGRGSGSWPALVGLTRADFGHLKRELALTDGNVGRHLEVLREA